MFALAMLALAVAEPLTFGELQNYGYTRGYHWTAAHLATSNGDLFNPITTTELCMYAMVGYDRPTDQSFELMYPLNTTHVKSLGSIGGFGSRSYLTGSEFAYSGGHTPQHILTAQQLCNPITDKQLVNLLLKTSDPAYAKELLLTTVSVDRLSLLDSTINESSLNQSSCVRSDVYD